MAANLTRRRFTLTAAAAFAAARLPAQSVSSAHTSVAAMDSKNILIAAASALTAQPVSMLDISAAVAALAAAFVLTGEERYAKACEPHITRWTAHPVSLSSVVELVPIAELARASSFLVDVLDLTAFNAQLKELLLWLTTARAPVIERDTKDHRASAWLLLTSALARALRDDRMLDACRARFRKPTLRNQIDEQGRFPQEFASANPFRNTLYNFDLLCGACQLLDSPLDPLWPYELIDDVSLRTVAAWLYPVLAEPSKWPGVADVDHFRDLPGRRAGLLFTGRAYNRPEYVELWRSTPPTVPPAIAASFPIRQPLLWTARAAHGL